MKILILKEKISKSSEQLEELQWNFPERYDLILKVTKKTRFHSLSIDNTNFEKVTTTVKIWSKRKLSEISKFLILGIGQNRKLGNLGNFTFFLLIHFIIFQFLSQFIFAVSESKITTNVKFEVKEHFTRFPSFRFSPTPKKPRKPRKFYFFF